MAQRASSRRRSPFRGGSLSGRRAEIAASTGSTATPEKSSCSAAASSRTTAVDAKVCRQRSKTAPSREDSNAVSSSSPKLKTAKNISR